MKFAMQQNEPKLAIDIDDALVRAAAGGDTGAYRTIFNTYWEPVYLFLLDKTRSPILSEEAAELIFRGLRDNAGKFRTVRDVKHFLASGSRNAALFILKKVAVASRLMGLPSDLRSYDEPLHHLNLLKFNPTEQGFIRRGTNPSSWSARFTMALKRLISFGKQ
ncbi:hypothetical protein [Parachryseolinea silvisoli]|uniref:hypothetical protein n=1 Tax=Parachryseolinea silvisoli TaxID=2873601 RepID=UPI002265A71E|nr:hypothetical protein [Parachryseolinea silvisoli]MCD9015247.1 hypothetical protein [Parachryseolinea silvisoli]